MVEYAECEKGEGNHDDCPMCSGEACNLCGAGCWDSSVTDCDHDVVERHQYPEKK